MSTVISKIAQVIEAYHNCLRRAEQPLGGDACRWARRHLSALSDLEKNHLPHGLGFDNGTTIDMELTSVGRSSEEMETQHTLAPCEPRSIYFNISYHPMNEDGFYIDWVHYRVFVIALERVQAIGGVP